MSYAEAIALLRGEKLHNEKVWQVATGRKNDSIGFCFMDGDKEEAEYAFQYLSGIVSEDICLILRFNNFSGVTLREAVCTYSDPCGGWFDTTDEQEVSLTDYDISIMTPIRYGFVDCSGIDDIFEWHDMLGERADVIRMLEERKREQEERKRREQKDYEAKIAEARRMEELEARRFNSFWKRLCEAEKQGILGKGTKMEINATQFGTLKKTFTIEFVLPEIGDSILFKLSSLNYEELRDEFYSQVYSCLGYKDIADKLVKTFNKLYNEEEIH